ncbi:MAG: hypothetical protein NUV59_02235 [Patescibacteria group bacterium]|nr:hypothetical protein [Patescibacteria group bacterium]
MTRKKVKKNSGRALGAVEALGAAAVAGAGTYYLLGPKGKQHQKKAKAFAAKIVGEWRGMQPKVKSAGKKTKKRA